MPIEDVSHVLRIIALHDAQRASQAHDLVLGRVDLPLGSLVKQQGRPGDRWGL